MAWTIGSADEEGEALPQERSRGLLFLGLLGLAVAFTGVFAGLMVAACVFALVLGAALLVAGLAGLRDARPPKGGPSFEIARLAEGPVEVVGRVVPPKQALLSPLTSTKCSYYAYAIHILGEDGERKLVQEKSKRCDFWLKDITGSILVRGDDIEVRVPPQLDEDLRTYDQTPRAVGEHLHKLDVDPFLSPGVRRAIFIHETRLDPGDNVLVRGTVVRDEEGQLILRSAPGAPSSVERWTGRTFVARPPKGARLRAALGMALLVGGTAGLLGSVLG
jgi:hypothetical protein